MCSSVSVTAVSLVAIHSSIKAHLHDTISTIRLSSWCMSLKPRTDDQVFLDKFFLDKCYLLVCTTSIGKFFLDKEPCSKAGVTSF